MSTVPPKRGHVLRERKIKPEILEQFAPRLPITELPDKYLVTEANPKPPVVHFAIPIEPIVLHEYATKHGLARQKSGFPGLIRSVQQVAEYVEYEIKLCWPFQFTADCGLLLELYDNYTMKKKQLIDEDEEDVIQMVQEELGLDESLQPKWYFDFHDPWLPGCDDNNGEDRDGEQNIEGGISLLSCML